MKLLYSLALYALFLNFASAQIPAYQGGKNPVSFQPPKEIMEKFKKEFPEVNPIWRTEEKYYVADFSDTSTFKEMTIVYDKNGKVVRRESEMENSTYPGSINSFYVKNYPGERVDGLAKQANIRQRHDVPHGAHDIPGNEER